jgi:hypothetical protein
MSTFIQKNQILIGLVLAGLIVGLFVYFGVSGNNLDFLKKQVELSEDPSYLFSEDFNPNKISVYGISIGDSESKINEAVISEPKNSAGWIHTKNGVGYRISDGKVVEIVLSRDETKRIGLLREDEIVIRFGEPDRIEDATGLARFSGGKDYFYIDKGLIVRFSGTGININILGKSLK